MTNTNTRDLALLAAICALGARTATAQPDTGEVSEAYTWSITPITGYRFSSSFEEADGDREFRLADSNLKAVALNIAAGSGGSFEILYSQQDTDVNTLGVLSARPRIDVDVEELHFGGTYEFSREDVRPFVAATIGGIRFDPHPGDLIAEDFFSIAIGGGVLLRATKRMGVRLEARMNAILVESNSDIFCDGTLPGNTGCLVFIDGEVLTQWEMRAGLVFRF